MTVQCSYAFGLFREVLLFGAKGILGVTFGGVEVYNAHVQDDCVQSDRAKRNALWIESHTDGFTLKRLKESGYFELWIRMCLKIAFRA